eukprot:3111285-Amphidinium_carterae.1
MRAFGKQHGIMILSGASVPPNKWWNIPYQLVYTDQQLAADIQEVEHIAGIPVTIVPAHTEPIESSLPDLLDCYKPRCVVKTGEGGKNEYFFVASYDGRCGPVRVTWDDDMNIIRQHNANCPETPVLLVLVLACHGGTGLQKLREHGVHVIGWDGAVSNPHAVEYANKFLAIMKANMWDLLAKD